MAHHATKRRAIHKVAHRAKPKSRMGTLAKVGAALAAPFPDAELLVASMANPNSGIRFVLGIAKRAGKRASEVQSVIFDKLKWTAAAAQGWLRDHGFISPKVDEGATFWRFRQQDPRRYREFRTVVPGTQRNPQLQFGRSPYDLKPDEIGRYHVVNDGGYIVAKQGYEFSAIAAARDLSEKDKTGVFQVVDTRDGSTVARLYEGEDLPEEENPAYFTVFKTRKEAEAAWSDSMPGRNDRVRYVRVHGGYRMLPVQPLAGRGHYGTTVEDMERGDSGFVEENPGLGLGGSRGRYIVYALPGSTSDTGILQKLRESVPVFRSGDFVEATEEAMRLKRERGMKVWVRDLQEDKFRGQYPPIGLEDRPKENPRPSTHLTWERQKREQYGDARYQLSIHHPAVPTRVFNTLEEAKALVEQAKTYKGSHYDIYDRQEGRFLASGVIGERHENPRPHSGRIYRRGSKARSRAFSLAARKAYADAVQNLQERERELLGIGWTSEDVSRGYRVYGHPGFERKERDTQRDYWEDARDRALKTMRGAEENPATLKQLYVAQHQGEDDGDSFRGKYPPSSTTKESGFRRMLRTRAAELVDENGKLTQKDRASYRLTYFRAFDQGAYRSHRGMMPASSLRTPGAGASSNPTRVPRTPSEVGDTRGDLYATQVNYEFRASDQLLQAAERHFDVDKDVYGFNRSHFTSYADAFYRGFNRKRMDRTGAGPEENPDYAGQWTSHEDAKPPFYVQVKDKGRWRAMYGGEGIYPNAREASRAMVAHASEYSGKFAWRALDGDGRIFDELKARPASNPTPGEAISAYDEHLATTLDPAFQEATPDEQAAAMTVQDATENPRPIVVGDKVKYTTKFLRSIGAYTGPMGHARGIVTDVSPMGGPGSSMLATIDWHDGGELPERVNVYNLIQAGVPNPYHGWSVQEESPISGWHTVSNWITHEGADRQAKLLSEETGKTHRVMHKDSGRVYQTFGGSRRENPDPGYSGAAPDVKAHIESHSGTWFTHLAYPHRTRHTGDFDTIYAAAKEAAVSSNRPVYFGSYLTGHEPTRSTGSALAVWPDGHITWASEVPLNKANPDWWTEKKEKEYGGKFSVPIIHIWKSWKGGAGGPGREFWVFSIEQHVEGLVGRSIGQYQHVTEREFKTPKEAEEFALSVIGTPDYHVHNWQKAKVQIHRKHWDPAGDILQANPSDLGQAAFDAGKQFRLSGAYSETGVANARVAGYGFSKWYNNLSPAESRGHRKATLKKNWMEGWAAGKRVEKKQGNPGYGGGPLPTRQLLLIDVKFRKSAEGLGRIIGVSRREGWPEVEQAARNKAKKLRIKSTTLEKWAGSVANPEPTAAALYEDFHGRPSAETLEIVTERHQHEWLTGLGTLVELKVATVTNLDTTISFAGDKKPPQLCSSEDGRQLYIEGGDQALDLKALKMAGPKWEKDSMVIGVLYELTYQTAKKFHKFRTTDYFHKLGEETGVQPTLLYDPTNHLLSISGGQYQVEPEGIVN
jgi:hypothetical protein